MSTLFNLSSGDLLSVDMEDEYGYVTGDVDVKAIQRAINANYVQSCFRIFVLYPDETVAYEIPITDIKAGGSYSENYQNGQRRSLNFSIYNDDGKYTPDINTFWAGTRLRFDMGVRMPDKKVYWFRKGVFVVTSTKPSHTPEHKIVEVSADDKFTLFDGATGKLGSTYTINVGTDIQTIFHDILRTDMGSGYPLDPQDFIYPALYRGRETQAVITKNAGETLGALLQELATQLSAEIFYNACGKLVVVPIDEVTLDKDKPLVYSFDTAAGDIGPVDTEGGINTLDFSFDYNSIVNRVIVIGTGLSGATFYSEASNDDAGSPLCWKRIGYRTGEIINDSNIFSETLARERAEYELRKKLILRSSTSADVLFNPFLEVNNVIAISDQFFGLTYERFIIQSISCSIDFSGKTNITFSNLNNLPFTVN